MTKSCQKVIHRFIHRFVHRVVEIQMPVGSTGVVEVKMKVSYRVAMAQELLRLLAEAQASHGECNRLRAMVARQVAELLA